MGSLDTRSPMISKSFVFRSIVPCLKDMTIWSAVSILAVISTGRFSKKRGGGMTHVTFVEKTTTSLRCALFRRHVGCENMTILEGICWTHFCMGWCRPLRLPLCFPKLHVFFQVWFQLYDQKLTAWDEWVYWHALAVPWSIRFRMANFVLHLILFPSSATEQVRMLNGLM